MNRVFENLCYGNGFDDFSGIAHVKVGLFPYKIISENIGSEPWDGQGNPNSIKKVDPVRF